MNEDNGSVTGGQPGAGDLAEIMRQVAEQERRAAQMERVIADQRQMIAIGDRLIAELKKQLEDARNHATTLVRDIQRLEATHRDSR